MSRSWTPSHHQLERIALGVELLPHNLDVYHTTDFIPPQFGARRQIITVHDLTFLHYPQFLTDESRRYYNDQIQFAVEHADHILTDSEASKRDLIKLLNVPPEKITVHLLGVDESFQPLPPETVDHYRRALQLPEDYFLFVGTFEPRKNIVGLGESYKALLAKQPDAPPLVLAGHEGWNFDALREQIEALDLGENCSGARRSRRMRCPPSTTLLSRWSHLRITKASAFRRWKRWRAARCRLSATAPRCRKSSAKSACRSIRTTAKRSPPRWNEQSATRRGAKPANKRGWSARRPSSWDRTAEIALSVYQGRAAS